MLAALTVAKIYSPQKKRIALIPSGCLLGEMDEDLKGIRLTQVHLENRQLSGNSSNSITII